MSMTRSKASCKCGATMETAFGTEMKEWLDRHNNCLKQPEQTPYINTPPSTPMWTIPPQREWVGLRWSDVPDKWCGDAAFMEGGKWAEKALKEKNT